MIRDLKSMVGAKVLEFDSGDLLAIVSGIIADPDTGMIEAFWVKPTNLAVRNAVLRTADIVDLKKNVYIQSDKVLAQAEDVIRISEILNDGRVFLGNAIQNEVGYSYGICINLAFDSKTFAIRQIYSRRSILGLITLDERIFSYDNILRVLPEMILVDDDATKKEIIMASTPEAAAG